MTYVLLVVAFLALWWLMSVALFLTALYIFDRDEASRFVRDVWRWIRL